MSKELEQKAREIADGWQMMSAKGMTIGDCLNGCAKEALQLKQNELDRLKSEKDTLYNALIGALDDAESGENPDTVAMSLALAKVNAETKYYISGFCVDSEGMTVDFMIDGDDNLHNVRVIHDSAENRHHWVSMRWIAEMVERYVGDFKND